MGDVATADVISRIAGTITLEDEEGIARTYKVRNIDGIGHEQLRKAAQRAAEGGTTQAEADATTQEIASRLVVGVTPEEFKGWPVAAQLLVVQKATALLQRVQADLGKGGAAPAATT